MKYRFDAVFYLAEFKEIEDKLAARYGRHQLREIIQDIYRYPTFYGIEYRETGVPIIKGENIGKDGLIDEAQTFDFIDEETHSRFPRTELKKNDLVFTVRGIIGKVGIFNLESGIGNINANVIKIRTKLDINYKFFWLYLNSFIGQKLIRKISSGQVQQTITVPDIMALPIPWPSENIQHDSVDRFDEALSQKKAKDDKARRKLASIDGLVLDALGISLPEKDDGALASRIFFANSIAVSGSRLDPHFLSPYFRMFVSAISKKPFGLLGTLAKFSNETWDQESLFGDIFPYIEIGAIDLSMGEISEIVELEKAQAPSRAKMLVKADDIILSTTRPNRGAIAMLDDRYDNHIASTGFAIIREISPTVSRRFLYLMLRHRICLTQMDQRSSGGNYPAITIDELQRIRIPTPPSEVQAEIAEKVDAIYAEAKRLRREGDEILAKAKVEVEKMILA